MSERAPRSTPSPIENYRLTVATMSASLTNNPDLPASAMIRIRADLIWQVRWPRRSVSMKSIQVTRFSACAIATALLAVQANAEELRPGADGELAGTSESICLAVESAAVTNGLPAEFFARLIWQESRFRSNAIGPVTRNGRQAEGIAQFMPATASGRNLLNPFDPLQALPKAAEFLRELREQFGNLGLAAAAYNAGPRRVREWLAGGASLPLETRNYVQSITGLSAEEWARDGQGAGQGGGQTGDRVFRSQPPCSKLINVLKEEPAPFVEALEQRIRDGSAQPWSVILTAGFSKTQIIGRYAQVQRRHASALSGYDAFITHVRLRSRGALPLYQVRVGVPDAQGASVLCNRILKERGACLVLRTPHA